MGRHTKIEPNERDLRMNKLFIDGKTYKEIGLLQKPHVSRQYVHQQIQKFFNTPAVNGGKYITDTPKMIEAAIKKNNKKIENEEKKYQRIFGCSKEQFILINGGECNNFRTKGTRACDYYQQRKNAIYNRNIEWQITFPEWWKIWNDSGYYNERGRGCGYCMARIGDTGSYEVGNIEIKTCAQNSSESYYKHSSLSRRLKALQSTKKKSISEAQNGAR